MNLTQNFTYTTHNQSAPAHHSRSTGHKIAWDRTTILTTTRYKTHWTSQNTQPLKQETLHSTVQTVPINAVNSGTPLFPKLLDDVISCQQSLNFLPHY